VLPAHATFTGIGDTYNPADYAQVQVVGQYNGGPSGEPCTGATKVTPRTLRISIGSITLNVRNWDSRPSPANSAIHAAFGCSGALGIV
jgi:hypothetical protein